MLRRPNAGRVDEMSSILGRLSAAVLVVGAFYAWAEAARLEATADAWHQLVALSNDIPPPPPPPRWVSWLPSSLRPNSAVSDQQRVTAEYWLSRYEGLVRASGADPNPAVMLTAANAAFRVARESGEVGAVAARQLDDVLEGYANVLKSDPGIPTRPGTSNSSRAPATSSRACGRCRPASRSRS